MCWLRRHWQPLVALLMLVLLQYRQLVLEGRILAGYDVLTYFYPNEQFAAESLRSGVLPLWNPYLFTGVPFLANVQTGIFYPLNALFLLAPVANAYAYSVALHVLLGAVFGYAFASSSLRLRRPSAFVAGAVYACGGFLTALAGHLNQLQASAWLPLILLLAHQCYRRASPSLAAVGALAVAVQFLAGHMQEFYISMAGVGLFGTWLVIADLIRARSALAASSARAAESFHAAPGEQRSFLLRLMVVGLMFALGAGLTAVQALPAYELTRESIRSSGLSYWDAITFSLPPWQMLRALLPAYGDPQPFSEWIGYVGVVTLVLAALAVAKSRHPLKLLFCMMAIIGLLLALGQYSGLFQWAYSAVPGLKLFRVPARWLLLYTLALAALAGMGVDTLGHPRSREWLRSFALVAGISAGFAALLVSLATVFNPGERVEAPGAATVAIWLAAAAVGLVIFALGLSGHNRLAAMAAAMMVAGELLLAGQGMEINRVNLPESVSALRPAVAHLSSQPGIFRVLPFGEGAFDPGDLAQLKTMLGRVLPPQAVYDYVVATKHKESLTPNLPLYFRIASLDGYDGGILPLRRYVALKQLLPLAGPNSADGRLREQLHGVPDPSLLSWLNVRYVLTDRTRDAWLDGVYYDLAISKTIGKTELRLPEVPALETTRVGVVSHLEGAANTPDGTAVARLDVTLDDGRTYSVPLRAGSDSAEGRYEAQPVAHRQARKAQGWRDDPTASDYLATVALPEPSFIQSLAIVSTQESEFVLRGISVIDERRLLSEPVVIEPALRLSHLGDVKIYENRGALERAFLVHDIIAVANDDEALATMEQPGFDPQRTAVVNASFPNVHLQGASEWDSVTIEEYRPELVRIAARSNDPSLLVLTDSYYPSWRVLVDGRPAELLRVDYLFRGVALPAGEHAITFVYEPASLRIGAAISLLALVSIVALLVRGGGLGRPRES